MSNEAAWLLMLVVPLALLSMGGLVGAAVSELFKLPSLLDNDKILDRAQMSAWNRAWCRIRHRHVIVDCNAWEWYRYRCMDCGRTFTIYESTPERHDKEQSSPPQRRSEMKKRRIEISEAELRLLANALFGYSKWLEQALSETHSDLTKRGRIRRHKERVDAAMFRGTLYDRWHAEPSEERTTTP